MYNYLGGSPYSSSGFQSPLTKENQLKMLEGQIEALRSMGNSSQLSLLEEINAYSSNLTEDEKKLIEKSPEYLSAKEAYESGFMGFLSSRFSSEYISTPQGRAAGEQLLSVIKDVKSKVKQELAAQNKKLQKVAELLDKHPELLDKIK
jgi:hypothetical protein